MDIVSLARFQFGMTTIFHFFFVPFSIGTAIVVAVFETLYIITKKEKYKKMTQFWGKLVLLSFAVGVVTGIIQEFQFGMNWSDYSRFVGDIFGAPLAIEALATFFLESTFLGLWMFTWDRVSKKLHLLFMWLVVLGSILSAFWILTANSFMQHPSGYVINNGRAELVDFFALVKNHQVWFEFAHVMSAAITMGGIIIVGLSAFQILKKRRPSFFADSLKIGLVFMFVGSLLVLGSGDAQMKALIEDQPMKTAATEMLYEDSGDPASWTVVGWADELEHKEIFGIKIPYMLSILSYGKMSGSVEGMNSLNEKMVEEFGEGDYYPAVNAIFWSFRIMAGFGVLAFLVSILGLFFSRKKKPILFQTKWMLVGLSLMTVVPFITNTCGWLVTELGRYPWTVYGLFKIEDSVSPNVSVASLFISNIVYFTLFAIIACMFVYFIFKTLASESSENDLLADKETVIESIDPFRKEAFKA